MECFDTSKGLGKLQSMPGYSVRVKHVIEPVLHVRGQVEIEFALHIFIINQFLQTLEVLYEITPGADGLILLRTKSLLLTKAPPSLQFLEKGETFVCVPKVQNNRLGIPVVRTKPGLRQLLLSRGSEAVKCKEFIMSKRELLYPIRPMGDCF